MARHVDKLQNLDIAMQMLRAIVSKLNGFHHEGAALADLRTVCAEALAKNA